MTRGSRRLLVMASVLLMPLALVAQGRLETVSVVATAGDRTVLLPGELQPFEAVALVARVAGYVETITVDRGDEVRRGQVLATLVAPELAAQVAEARARIENAVANRVVAEANQDSARLTYERLLVASATAGAVAGLELKHAEDAMRAGAARVEAASRAVEAARASADAVTALEGYLRVSAPFAGRITERLVHPGALVGPAAGPLVRVEQTSRLRLVVPVPEQFGASAARGRKVAFKVPAHGARTFTGTLARVAGALDPRTRTMAVELDVDNADAALAPGMFPQVTWPVTPAEGTVSVPATAIVTTTERTFVIRVRQGKAEWVAIRRLAARGDLVEVTGALAVGTPSFAAAPMRFGRGLPCRDVPPGPLPYLDLADPLPNNDQASTDERDPSRGASPLTLTTFSERDDGARRPHPHVRRPGRPGAGIRTACPSIRRNRASARRGRRARPRRDRAACACRARATVGRRRERPAGGRRRGRAALAVEAERAWLVVHTEEQLRALHEEREPAVRGRRGTRDCRNEGVD